MIQPNPSATVKVEDLEMPRPFSAFYASAIGRVISMPEGFVLCVNNCPRELPATINKGDLISCKAVAPCVPKARATIPDDSAARKDMPLCRGLLDYFPAALAMVAKISKLGNDKHNPGQPIHHARGKSSDHADCIMRHLIDRGTIDPSDKMPHTGHLAWRALALLQEELEAAGAPLARGARLPEGEGK